MKEKLKYIVFETILIFIGVVGAFWVDRYKDRNESEKIRLEIYRRIKDDMVKDSIDFAKIKRGVVIQKERIASVLSLISSNRVSDSLMIKLFQIETEFYDGEQYSLRDNTDAYESIKNSASMEIFERDTAFTHIRNYYVKRKAFEKGIDGYRTYSISVLTPYFDKYFDRSSVNYISDVTEDLAVIENPDFQLKDFRTKEFKNILIRLRENLIFIPAIKYYQRINIENINRIEQNLKVE